MSNSNNIRHEWYQNDEYVIVTLFAKNARKEQVHIVFHEQSMECHIHSTTAASANYSLNVKLAHAVMPNECVYEILTNKIEIKLKKKQDGRWVSLEYKEGNETLPVTRNLENEDATKHVYPSSSKHKIDWDALERDVKKEEQTEKPGGEEALNKLFQQIYSTSSEEVRRAMNKSFVESGGTCLSTNWNEVSKESVKVSPPQGMEAKRFDA